MAFATLVTGESANPQLTKDLIKSSNKTITNTDYYDVQLTNLKVNKDYVVQLRWAYDDGTFGDYSTTYSLKTTEEDEPAIPSTPILVAGAGFFTVKWDGKDNSNNNISNIEKVAVYVSGGSFDSTIESASFTASGTINIAAPIGSYTVIFKSVRVSKVISNASTSASVSVTSDVSSVGSTANSAYSLAGSAYSLADIKLAQGGGVIAHPTTKQITSINTNSGIEIYNGSLNGKRIILNSNGLAAYNGSEYTFVIDANGDASFKGSITAGSTITGSDFKTGANGSYINILTNSTSFGNVGSIVFHTGTGDYGATQDGGMYATPGISASTIPPTLLIQSPTINASPSKYSEIKMTGARTGDLFGRVFINADSTRIYNSLQVDNYLMYYINSVTTNWTPTFNNTYDLGYSGVYGTYAWKTLYAFSTVNPSDQRLKTDIKPSSLGLSFIKTLNPVSYKWIEGGNELIKNDEGIIDRNNLNIKSIPGKRTHWGFLAQEVKQSVDQTGIEDFGGWVISDLNDPNSNQSLNYTEFISPIVKAIQELAAKVENLEKNLVS